MNNDITKLLQLVDSKTKENLFIETDYEVWRIEILGKTPGDNFEIRCERDKKILGEKNVYYFHFPISVRTRPRDFRLFEYFHPISLEKILDVLEAKLGNVV